MLYNALMTWDLLLIDDLGTEMATQETFGLSCSDCSTRGTTVNSPRLSHRISKCPILAKQYDSRIASRLMGNFLIYSFPPGDLRLRPLKADV